MGRQTGFEPATPGTTNQCSNQLSYYRHKELLKLISHWIVNGKGFCFIPSLLTEPAHSDMMMLFYFRYATSWNRRTAQCGQKHSLQRPHQNPQGGGGKLSILPLTQMWAWYRCRMPAWYRLIGQDNYPDPGSHRDGGHRRTGGRCK